MQHGHHAKPLLMEKTDFRLARNSVKEILQVWKINLGDLRKLEVDDHISDFEITLF